MQFITLILIFKVLLKLFIVLLVVVCNIGNVSAKQDDTRTLYKNNINQSKIVDNTDWYPLIYCNSNSCNSNYNYPYDYNYKKINKLCNGCYIEPEYPLAATKNHLSDTFVINADRSQLISKGQSIFDGNVVVAKNNQQITADHLTVQQNKQGNIISIIAEQRVKIIEPGLRVIGTYAKMLPKENYKIIYDANYRLYNKHATGNADNIEVFNDDVMLMHNASYTTCKPESNNWHLGTSKVKFNKITGRGEAWGAKMFIKNRPVFYWPYINFSIDNRRKSGFLMPLISNSSKHGLSLGIPWYWNLAPNYDYTVTALYYSKRGSKFNNKFRYLTKKSSGSLSFNFLPRDKDNVAFVRKKLVNRGDIPVNDLRFMNLKDRYKRFAFWFNNKTQLSDSWKLNVNYDKVSDDNYLQDFGQDLEQKNMELFSNLEELSYSSELHLKQYISLENDNKYGILNVKLSKYQTLHPFNGPIAFEQHKQLPGVTWYSNYLYLPKQLRTNYSFSYINFKMNDLKDVANISIIPNYSLVSGNRKHLRYSLDRPLFKPYGYLQPRVQLDALSYDNTKLLKPQANNRQGINYSDPQHRSRVLPIFDCKTSLKFIRNISTNWHQTLDPSIYYLYVPKINQYRYPVFDTQSIEFNYYQLFRDTRYVGVDRLPEANQLTFGIKSSINSNQNETKAYFAIARARLFRNLTPYLGESLGFSRWSPIAVLFGYSLSKELYLETDLVRQSINKTRSATVRVKYELSKDKVVNLGYHYVNLSNIQEQQGRLALSWAVKEDINLLGAVYYDFKEKRPLYNLTGVEFHGCCSSIRLMWAKSISILDTAAKSFNKNNKFLLQVVFNGFTDVGNLENNYILNKVPGYRTN